MTEPSSTTSNRLFEWYLNNVKLRKDYSTRDNENWVPVKLDKYRKIDAFMAFLDAHTSWMRRCPAAGAGAAGSGGGVLRAGGVTNPSGPLGPPPLKGELSRQGLRGYSYDARRWAHAAFSEKDR